MSLRFVEDDFFLGSIGICSMVVGGWGGGGVLVLSWDGIVLKFF